MQQAHVVAQRIFIDALYAYAYAQLLVARSTDGSETEGAPVHRNEDVAELGLEVWWSLGSCLVGSRPSGSHSLQTR